jgi:hypothetical protein
MGNPGLLTPLEGLCILPGFCSPTKPWGAGPPLFVWALLPTPLLFAENHFFC